MSLTCTTCGRRSYITECVECWNARMRPMIEKVGESEKRKAKEYAALLEVARAAREHAPHDSELRAALDRLDVIRKESGE